MRNQMKILTMKGQNNMKVEERVCMKHENEIKGPLILRYESTEANCPLCKALENQEGKASISPIPTVNNQLP